MNFGIALKFPQGVNDLFLKCNDLVSGFIDNEVQLGQLENIPHVSLLQGTLHNSMLACECIEAVSKFSRSDLQFSFQSVIYKDSGWYFAKLSRNEMAVKLQAELLNKLSSQLLITDKDRNKDISSYSNAEKDNFLRYGYRYIGPQYTPHITIGRSKDRGISPDFREIREVISSVLNGIVLIPDAITVYSPGVSGEHTAAKCSLALQDN